MKLQTDKQQAETFQIIQGYSLIVLKETALWTLHPPNFIIVFFKFKVEVLIEVESTAWNTIKSWFKHFLLPIPSNVSCSLSAACWFFPPPFSKVIKIHYMWKHCHNVHAPEMPCTSIKRPPSRSYWSTTAVSDELLSLFPPNVLTPS